MRFPQALERQVLVAIEQEPDAHIVFDAREYEHGRVVIYRDNLAKTLHRYLWEQVFGAIPAGKFLRRTCNSARCVNPHHHALSTTARPPSTTCPNGHRYTAENTRRDARGIRHCRTCERKRQQRLRDAKPSTRKKGECRKGHKLTPANTYVSRSRKTGRVTRRCKRCHLARVRASRQENR